jgi:integrase
VSLGASVGGRKGQPTKHFPSLKDLNNLGELLRELRDRPALALPLRNACILQAFTIHRSAVIAEMRWAWFDLDAAVPTLRVPREFMKMSDAERGDFLMPLSPFVADFVRKLPRHHPERLFVSARDKTVAMKSTALPQVYAKALKLGGRMVPHGWRSAYSTWAHNLLDENDSPVFNPVGVEFALDHEPRSQTRRAYDHVMIVHRANKMRAPLLAWQDILFRAMHGEHIPALTLSDLAA